MEAGPTLRFAMVARELGAVARAAGLVVPAFRSPPRALGSVRTIRRYEGGAVVAVRTRDRPFDRVVADMVEGVLAANTLEGAAAHRRRVALWEGVADLVDLGAGVDRSPADAPCWEQARVAERQTQAA